MKIKKFTGETMQEAFDQVKHEMGPEAIILHTKTKKRNGILGLLGKEMVEITASTDVRIMDSEVSRETKKDSPIEKLYKTSGTSAAVAEEVAPEKPVAQEEIQTTKVAVEKQSPASSSGSEEIEERFLQYEMHEIKSMVSSILNRVQYSDVSCLSEEMMEFYLMLVQQQVSEDLSKEVVHRIHNELRNDELENPDVIRDVLKNVLTGIIQDANPIQLDKKGKRVALIGPTGVGKTTTIAKLAANFALKEGKSVALITIDTYRIAAVEQLRTYADIINIPLEVVLTTNEISQALDKHKDKDLILIDTAGRSQKNSLQMEELKEFLDVIDADETHLVLSTVVNYDTLLSVIDNFKHLGFDKLIFTKLDEAMNFGLIVNILKNVSKSISYITTGQSVPDDINIGDPEMLADLLIGDRTI